MEPRPTAVVAGPPTKQQHMLDLMDAPDGALPPPGPRQAGSSATDALRACFERHQAKRAEREAM